MLARIRRRSSSPSANVTLGRTQSNRFSPKKLLATYVAHVRAFQERKDGGIATTLARISRSQLFRRLGHECGRDDPHVVEGHVFGGAHPSARTAVAKMALARQEPSVERSRRRDLRCSGSAGADTGEVSAGSSAFGRGRDAAMVTFAAHCE